MGAFIKAISYYLPERIVTNEDLVAEFPEWDVEKVYSKVGVKERHLADASETAGDLAGKALLLARGTSWCLSGTLAMTSY